MKIIIDVLLQIHYGVANNCDCDTHMLPTVQEVTLTCMAGCLGYLAHQKAFNTKLYQQRVMYSSAWYI